MLGIRHILGKIFLRKARGPTSATIVGRRRLSRRIFRTDQSRGRDEGMLGPLRRTVVNPRSVGRGHAPVGRQPFAERNAFLSNH